MDSKKNSVVQCKCRDPITVGFKCDVHMNPCWVQVKIYD